MALKMALFAPMPSARVMTATAVKPGRLSRFLTAYRMSLKRDSIASLSFPIGLMLRHSSARKLRHEQRLNGVRSPTVKEGYSRIMPSPMVGLLTRRRWGISAILPENRNSVIDDPTVFQAHNPIAVGSVRFRVRHLNDGGALFVKAFEKIHD